MNDDRLEQLLRDTPATYRPPPPAPLAELWTRIEREAFDRPIQSPRTSAWWLKRLMPLAAAAALGLVVGRVTAPEPVSEPVVAAGEDGTPSAPDPLQSVTSEYLGETAVLLTALPGQVAQPDERFLSQARELLSTTRLLLDSPSVTDPELAGLLEDLELVLVQIARLPAADTKEEADLITETMEFRDVLARLRAAAVSPTLTRS